MTKNTQLDRYTPGFRPQRAIISDILTHVSTSIFIRNTKEIVLFYIFYYQKSLEFF